MSKLTVHGSWNSSRIISRNCDVRRHSRLQRASWFSHVSTRLKPNIGISVRACCTKKRPTCSEASCSSSCRSRPSNPFRGDAWSEVAPDSNKIWEFWDVKLGVKICHFSNWCNLSMSSFSKLVPLGQQLHITKDHLKIARFWADGIKKVRLETLEIINPFIWKERYSIYRIKTSSLCQCPVTLDPCVAFFGPKAGPRSSAGTWSSKTDQIWNTHGTTVRSPKVIAYPTKMEAKYDGLLDQGSLFLGVSGAVKVMGAMGAGANRWSKVGARAPSLNFRGVPMPGW